MSNDYGKTWKNISSNIPVSPVNVIREDPKNENILYVGTDNGAYVSFNQGQSWEAFSKGFPSVAIHDIAIQPEASHLLLGTHGRSIYKADIAPLQKMDVSKMNQDLVLFEVESMRYSGRWGSSFGAWYDTYEPSTKVAFYTNEPGEKTIKILSENNIELNSIKVNADKGFNYADYDLTLTESGKELWQNEDPKLEIKKAANGKHYLPKGKYTVLINKEKTTLEIK
jgi:hypothetical protein